MNLLELLLFTISLNVTYHILKYNHRIIQEIKRATLDIKYQDNRFINNSLEKVNQNIAKINNHLTVVVPLSIMGLSIFYFYLQPITFFLISFVFTLVLISFSAVKEHYKKLYRSSINLNKEKFYV